MEDKLYFQYWGKARKEGETGPEFHLLPYHCLDVAAVGWFLLKPELPLCRQLAAQLQVKPEWLRTLFVFCLALHDLGKFARAFQSLQANLSPLLVKADSNMPYTERHDSLGFILWQDARQHELTQSFFQQNAVVTESEIWVSNLDQWLEIVTGHHGMPPKSGIRRQNYFNAEDEQAALNFLEDSVGLLLKDFDFLPLQNKALKKKLKAASWQLAGIAVLADWLGSNQTFFKFYDKPMGLTEYWQKIALKKAEAAVADLPRQPEIAAFENIETLFPFIRQPTPLQHFASTVPLPDQPQLFILEDVTGAGKTEAALILSQRLMAQGLARRLSENTNAKSC